MAPEGSLPICAAPPLDMLYAQKMTLRPWDLKLPPGFGNVFDFILYSRRFQAENGYPYLPDLHRLADFFNHTSESKKHADTIRHLYWMSNHIRYFYHPVRICKKTGGIRQLYVPEPRLKRYQQLIHQQILTALPVCNQCATAYVKGANLRDAALPHLGKPLVVKLDIHDFYGSIRFKTVYERVFGEDRFPKKVGMILANLCCCEGALPQGAPTSPAISNIVMAPLDEAILAYCRPRGIAYTRYSDDMTFSGDFDEKVLISTVKQLLLKDGFRINRGKTQVIRQGQRQIVNGVVVNEKAQLPAAYRRKIRQEVYFCNKYGVRDHVIRTHQAQFLHPNAAAEDGLRVMQQQYLLHLLGQISYALMIDPDNAEMQRYQSIMRGYLIQIRVSQRVKRFGKDGGILHHTGLLADDTIVF